MKLYIPELGDVLVLSEDWHFTLHGERRNESLFCHFGIERVEQSNPVWRYNSREFPTSVVKLPKGTELKVDRIYIKQNQEEFNSITFVAQNLPKVRSGKRTGIVRFWAKLKDVNNIEFDLK